MTVMPDFTQTPSTTDLLRGPRSSRRVKQLVRQLSVHAERRPETVPAVRGAPEAEKAPHSDALKTGVSEMQERQAPVGGVPIWYVGVTLAFLVVLGMLS